MSEDKSNPDSKVLIPEILEALENKRLVLFNTYATSALLGKKTLKGKIDIKNETVFEYANGQGLLFIKDYEKQTKEFVGSTQKLLVFVIHCFTKQGEVRFKVKDYQKLRRLKDYSETRKQLTNDLNLLLDSSLKFNGKIFNGKKVKTGTIGTNFISDFAINNGNVSISLAPKFAEFLVKSGFLMLVPKEYFSMQPVPSQILYKLLTHARINKYNKKKKEVKGKRTEARKSFQIISVEALLKSVGSIPRYKDVTNDRHLRRRIIDPLENGLNELLEVDLLVSWEYCNAKGEPLAPEQLCGVGYAPDDTSKDLEPLTPEQLCGVGVDKNDEPVEIKSKKDKYYLKWDNFKKSYIRYNLNTPIETTLVSPTKELSPANNSYPKSV